LAQASGVLISAVLLWDVLFRGQLGVSIVFLEEMWSRNLGQLFVSPLRPLELVAALLTMSLIRTVIGVGGAALIAIPLFHFSVFDFGFALIAFFINLIVMGWAIGLIMSGIVMRHGLGAESIAWAAAFFLQPFGAIFYPVSIYPEWLQEIIKWLPLPHIFEALRSVFAGQGLPRSQLVWAYGLDAAYLLAAFFFFGYMFEQAREKGYLLKAQD